MLAVSDASQSPLSAHRLQGLVKQCCRNGLYEKSALDPNFVRGRYSRLNALKTKLRQEVLCRLDTLPTFAYTVLIEDYTNDF